MKIAVSLLAICLAVTIPRLRASDVYEPPDREPTSEETLILELMNRFRADPKADAQRIAPNGAPTSNSGRGVDWKMFVSEMNELKSAPPLVFNLELLDAARKHSHYMILNDLTHVEEPDKPGFFGAGFGERCTASGYKGSAGGENCYRDARNAWGSHKGFVVDDGAGPGGMQPERGHRMNMVSERYKEVGCSAVPHNGRFSVTHDFGSRRTRMAGGVIYIDKDSDKFYSIGEGMGAVTIKANDGTSTATWKSGAFALDLKGDGPVTISAEYAGQTYSKTFEGGKDNIKFDWVMPEKLALDRADQLMADLAKIKEKKSSTYTNALFSLYLNTRGLALDEGRIKKIDELTGGIGPELEKRQKAVLEALQNYDVKTFSATYDEQRKPYRGTIADLWFQRADQVANLKYNVKVLETQAKENPKLVAANKKQLVAQIQDLEKQMAYAELKQELADMLAVLNPAPSRQQRRRRG